MQIAKDSVVKLHYTLYDDDGLELDSSVGKTPLEYIHGKGMLISGLEAMLEGKEAGAKFKAVIEPSEAYGEFNKNLIVEIPRSQFETDMPIEIGMAFQAGTTDGSSVLVHVIGINDDIITVDGNHELAGKRLTFDVEVVSVRKASDTELSSACSGESCDCGSGGCGEGCSGCGGGCGSCS
ncbi:MAG: peptidylprolyl isomerase [Treponema sp.]